MKPKPQARHCRRFLGNWARNIRPPRWKCSYSVRRQFSMRTSGKMPARNMKKSLSMLRDPAHPKRQRAQLRIAQTKLQPKGPPTVLSSLTTPDPEVDAERLFGLSQAYRSEKKESEMFATLDSIAQKYPHSVWNRRSADGCRKLLLGAPGSPEGRRLITSGWWTHSPTARMPTTPNGASRGSLSSTSNPTPISGSPRFSLKYPVSANAVDALYWLGRSAERSGNPGHARAYYEKAIERFPQTYFAHAAANRLQKLGPGAADAVRVPGKNSGSAHVAAV